MSKSLTRIFPQIGKILGVGLAKRAQDPKWLLWICICADVWIHNEGGYDILIPQRWRRRWLYSHG